MDGEGVELSDEAALLTALTVPCMGSLMTFILVLQEIREDWYQTLNHPLWNPPPTVHMVVWICLYVLVGFASFFVWKEGGGFEGSAKTALIVYGLNLAVSWCFVPVFFESRNIHMAYYICNTTLATALLETLLFYRVSVIGTILLVPYISWLVFSSFLLRSVIKKNPKSRTLFLRKRENLDFCQ